MADDSCCAGLAAQRGVDSAGHGPGVEVAMWFLATSDSELGAAWADAATGVCVTPRAARSRSLTGLARAAVSRFDGTLRRTQGVFEFSADVDCLLRAARTTAACSFRLQDGAMVQPGDLVLDLHLWNEHIPRPSARQPDCAWGVDLLMRLRASFGRLAAMLRIDPSLVDVKAIHARAALTDHRRKQSFAQFATRLGFETLEDDSASERSLHDLAENLWLWSLAWTFNPASLRRRSLLRHRQDLWMSADRLCTLYHATVSETATALGAGARRPAAKP